MKSSRIKFTILISVFFLLYSCEADIDIRNISGETNIQPSVIVPIGSAEVSFGDFLINNNIDEITIGANNELYFQEIDTVEFKYPSITLNNNQLVVVGSYNLWSGQVVVTKPFSNLTVNPIQSFINLGLNSNSTIERIDSITVSTTSIDFRVDIPPTLKNLNPSNLEITLSFPNNVIRKLDGTSSDITFSPTIFGVPSRLILSDFVMNTKDKATGIPVEMRIVLKTESIPIILDESSIITCSMNFNEINYQVAYGFFDTEVVLEQTIRQIVNTSYIGADGLLKFKNPNVEITVESNIGSYLKFNIDYIKAFVADNPNFNPIYAWFDNHTSNSASIDMDIKPNRPGESVTKVMPAFDENWGETDALFENVVRPDVLEYKFSVLVNDELTLNDPSPQFITPDAMIKAYVKTTVPLQFNEGSYYFFEGKFDNFFDDVSFVLDRISDNPINTVALIFDIKNGLPVKSQFIFEFFDASGNIVPSDLKKIYEIQSASVNEDGIVVSGRESSQILSVSVTRDQLEKLRNVSFITYKIVIDGETINSKIHFTKLDTFKLKVGFFINAII